MLLPSSSQADLVSTICRQYSYLAGFQTTDRQDPKPAFATRDWYFKVCSEVDGMCRVRFICRAGKNYKGSDGEVGVDANYTIDAKTLKHSGLPALVRTFETGVLSVPFKVRPNVPNTKAQLSGSGTLGAGFAWRAKTDSSTTEVSPIVFSGLSQVVLQQNVGAAAKEVHALDSGDRATSGDHRQIEAGRRRRMGSSARERRRELALPGPIVDVARNQLRLHDRRHA
jgi:hypothetical protein